MFRISSKGRRFDLIKCCLRNYCQGKSGVQSAQMAPSTAGTSGNGDPVKIPLRTLTKMDRFALIVTRTMKPHEIPVEASQAVIAKAQDKRRILVNLGLFAFTLIGCVIAIISGKRLKKKGGYSLQDRNRQRYEKARERDAKAKQQ